MRWLKFLLFLFITLSFIYVLNRPWGKVTFAPGHFFNPYQGFWQNAVSKDDTCASELTLEGLTEPVDVVIDDRGVPHIFAEQMEDLYFAQGYITARDRLWQMEFQTHVAAGRLAEIAGRGPNDAILKMDRTERRRGMVWAAERSWNFAKQDPQTRLAYQAYSRGVNAYIDQLEPADWPVEYKILNYQPEAWSPLKTSILNKYMAEDLCTNSYDLEFTYAMQHWGREIFDLLYPERPYEESPIIPEGTRYRFPFSEMVQVTPPTAYHPDSLLPIADIAPSPDEIIGSNNWAVHGSKTRNGKPLLANDPHLGLNLPSIWYEIQLHTPQINVYGASLPGAPAVIIGFNDSIAWGITNGARDVIDYYQVTFQDNRKSHYRSGSVWQPTTIRVEEIPIRGGDVFLDTVYYTDLGPVMYDEKFGETPYPLAVRWMAHDASNEAKTFLDLCQAKNYQDYQNAISHFATPSQNIVFASAEGDVAIQQQGKFVAKWPEQGRFILNAADSTHHWQGFIPRNQNPSILNPARGFVSSANQHATDNTYPYYYTGKYEAYRNRRLNQLLAENDSMTIEHMKRFQQDNYSVSAADALPILLRDLDSTALTPDKLVALRELQHWDFFYDADKIAPTIYQLWWDLLYDAIWKDDLAELPVKIRGPHTSTTIRILRDSAVCQFYDLPGTQAIEGRKALVNTAFHEAIDSLYRINESPDQWQWAARKATTIKHLLGYSLKPFNRYNINIGGYKKILNATSERHGPSWRMIVQLGDKVEAYGVYPGGQNGNPGHPGYDAFIDDWAAGKYYKLWFMQSVDEQGEKPSRRVRMMNFE